MTSQVWQPEDLFATIDNQNSVKYSVSVVYFTNTGICLHYEVNTASLVIEIHNN
jgi:hypothetical protein